jgi:hypothetical protein
VSNLLVECSSDAMKQTQRSREKAKNIFVELIAMIKGGYFYKTEEFRDWGSSMSQKISQHPNVLCGVIIEWSDVRNPNAVTVSISVYDVPELTNSANLKTNPCDRSQKYIEYSLTDLTKDTAKDIAAMLEAGGFRLA